MISSSKSCSLICNCVTSASKRSEWIFSIRSIDRWKQPWPPIPPTAAQTALPRSRQSCRLLIAPARRLFHQIPPSHQHTIKTRRRHRIPLMFPSPRQTCKSPTPTMPADRENVLPVTAQAMEAAVLEGGESGSGVESGGVSETTETRPSAHTSATIHQQQPSTIAKMPSNGDDEGTAARAQSVAPKKKRKASGISRHRRGRKSKMSATANDAWEILVP